MGIQRTFAENMRMYRRRAGLTQEELAEKSGLHRTYIGGIEQMRVNASMKNIGKIADALNVDPALLFLKSHGSEPGPLSGKDAGAASPSHETLADYKPGDYAICIWEDDGIALKPISVTDEDLTVRILCALAEEGHEEDLAEAYEEIQEAILSYFKDRKRRTIDDFIKTFDGINRDGSKS